MPKSLVLGNGNMLVCFDEYARIRDLYYHYVGLENHVGEPCVHKIGVFCEGKFSWMENKDWEMSIDYKFGTMVSDVRAVNKKLQIELRFSDVVHNEKNLLIRKINVFNHAGKEREIKLFLHQQFKIFSTERKDTGYFEPDENVLIHYEGKRVFVIGGEGERKKFDEFCVGNYGIEGKEGTWKDAEDGALAGNPIEHGPVDSVVSFALHISPDDSGQVYYWLGCAMSIEDAIELHKNIKEKAPSTIFLEGQNGWKKWLEKKTPNLDGLDKRITNLFDKSLFIMRTHVGNAGDIIASGDSGMLQYGHGTYAFVWPRDAAFSAIALCKAGMHDLTKPFFEFCKEVVNKKGFFMQKYRSNRTLGSTWHPWIREGNKQYPIQEDETALVLVALWKYYLSSSDLDFVQELYDSLVHKAALFMCEHQDKESKLPHGSYDLWERKFGTTTFTSAAVYGGLTAASNFATLLGKDKDRRLFSKKADQIRKAIIKNLHNPDKEYFFNLIQKDEKTGKVVFDETIDISSFYGIYRFNILDLDDKKLQAAFETAKEKLCCKSAIGGVARFENDDYQQISYDAPPNPWFITTLWCAQYEIACAKTLKQLQVAGEKIVWAYANATKAGLMSEQIRSDNGVQVSAGPLTWSHGEFVSTVIDFAEKRRQLKKKKK